MNHASKLRLSLRKLFVVTLAAGPLAVLPSPVWAVLPTNSSFSVTSGTASAATGVSGNVVTITASDRAVLVWGNSTLQSAVGGVPTAATDTVTNFFIGAGETYNFALPPSGSVLNRVKAGNATAALQPGTNMGAVINGSLLSDGKVFVLADTGNISVGTGAVINTSGGLVLSTLVEPNDSVYAASGSLLFNDETTTRTISLGAATVSGPLSAYSATTSVSGISTSGDLLLQSVSSASAMPLGAMTVGGNLLVTSNKGAITQTGAAVVGFGVTGTQSATFSTNGGNVAITLTNPSNNFEGLSFSTGNGAVSIVDVSSVALGASSTLGALTVNSTAGADSLGINFNAGTAISTTGAVSVGGNATFTSTGYGSAINIGNASSVGGTLTMNTANGAMTFNGTGNSTTGNLTLGTFKSDNSAPASITLGGLSINSTTGLIDTYPTPGNYAPSADKAGVNNPNSALPTVTFAGAIGGTNSVASPQFFYNGGASATKVSGALVRNATQVDLSTNNNTTSGAAASITAGTGTYNATTATVTFTGGTLQKFGGAINVTSTSNVVVSATSTLSAGDLVNLNGAAGALSVAIPAITVRGANVDFNNAGTAATTTGVATINATAGNAIVGTLQGSNVTVTATGGNITQRAGSIITTTNTTGSSSLTASGAISLPSTNSLVAGTTLNVSAGASNSSIKSDANLVLGEIVAGANLDIDAGTGSIAIGTGVGTVATKVNVVGNLTLTAAAGITDANYTSQTVGGNLYLNTTNNNVVLDAATALGALSPRVSYGAIGANLGTGTLALAETTTVNLGDIGAASATITSATGGIVDSGNVTATTLTLSAATGQNIALDSTNHSVTNLVLANATGATSFVSNRTAGVTVSATSNVSNLTVTNADSTQAQGVNLGNMTVGMTVGNLNVSSSGQINVTGIVNVTGNASLSSSQAAATAIDDTTGGLTVAGVTTLAATAATVGGISLNTAGKHDFSSVVLNGAVGAVTINDINALTVSGSTSETSVVTLNSGSGGVVSSWNLVLGDLNVGNLTATAGNGGGAGTNSGTITQAAGTKISTYGNVSFTTTNNSITVNNTGNNFGAVNASLGSGNNTSASVAIRESGTMRLGSISSNRSNVTLTSELGSIVEGATVNSAYSVTNATLTLNATSGSVLLGGLTNTTATTSGTSTSIAATAPNGAVQLRSSSSDGLALRNITANSLSVTYSGSASITQVSGTSVKVYGSSNFTSSNTGTGGINLSSASNNFGRVSLTTGAASANINIVEEGTLNLGSVTMPGLATGTFSATSGSGDIIDTGLLGVRPGGNTTSVGSGQIILTASSGNIILDDPTTDFPSTGGIVFNAKNVTLAPLGGAPVYLGGASASSTGNLSVTSATGAILQAGAITATGDAVFTTGNQPITLTNSANNFGTVRFTGSAVKITEGSNMDIVTGSAATGLTEFVSSGNISIVNRGGVVNLGSSGTATVFMSAAGNIVLPKLLQSTGTVTVLASGTKDLSALSVSNDLGGKSPSNFGTGTYLPPSP